MRSGIAFEDSDWTEHTKVTVEYADELKIHVCNSVDHCYLTLKRGFAKKLFSDPCFRSYLAQLSDEP